MRLIGNKILVLPIDDNGIKSNILHVVNNGRFTRKVKGTVELCGPGKIDPKTGERIPMKCKQGDTVYFIKREPVMCELEGREYFLLSDEDVVGRM